jgi:hypothetical protein
MYFFTCDPSGTFPKETVVLGAWERLESYAKDIIEVSILYIFSLFLRPPGFLVHLTVVDCLL